MALGGSSLLRKTAKASNTHNSRAGFRIIFTDVYEREFEHGNGEMTTMMRKYAIYTFLLVFGLVCTALASDQRMIADPSVPAASGKAHLSKDNNGNLRLKLDVDHLAKPGSLTPTKESYVVWIQPRGKEPQNEGTLKVGDNLKGNFEATVPNEYFEVFVTAEDNPAAQTPSGPKLLRAEMQP
jgi:hypothetical protein